MPDTPHLRPATLYEIAETLFFALRYEGRMRVHHADDMMARIPASVSSAPGGRFARLRLPRANSAERDGGIVS